MRRVARDQRHAGLRRRTVSDTTPPASPQEIPTTIHARGAARLDAVIDLVAFAARPKPIVTALDELPRRIADALGSDVCSLYLMEGDVLVMRGNVGFTQEALGEVRLSVGEGLTGMAVEWMRPVSAAMASSHDGYRHFPSLGEERFPSFLALPIPGTSGALGAVVVQRRGGPYDSHDIELLAALVGILSVVIDRARLVDHARSTPSPPTTGSRRVTLPGRAVRPGRALGIVSALRRPVSRTDNDPVRTRKEVDRALEKAIFSCETTLDSLQRAASRASLKADFLTMHRTILADGRMRERVLEIASHRGIGQALAQVASEATRTARLVSDSTMDDRAQEMSELCDVLRVLASASGAPEIPRDAVWIGEQLTVFDLLVASRSRPSAVVLSERVASERARTLLALLDVPTVAEVSGLFRWASDGDVALVDADHGLVRLNPTRRERDEARNARNAE